MASIPEDNGSPPKELHQEEAAADEPQQSIRQQRPQEMRLQQKKIVSGACKGDKRRQVDTEDVDGSAGADSGEDTQREEGGTTVPRAHTLLREAAAAETAEQHDTSSADDCEEGQPPSTEAAAEEAWGHDRQPPITGPVDVIYCGVCGLPPDYCEFGSQWKRCKGWLEQHHPELLRYALPPEELAAAKEELVKKSSVSSSHRAAAAASAGGTSSPLNNTSGPVTGGDLAQQLAENLRLSAAATQEAAAALGLDAAEDIPGDAQVPGVKKKPAKGKAAAQPAIVSIQRQSRAKRKTMTVIVGLDFFGVKLANATKIFSKRFACGASVSKNPLGHPPQQVEVQGDVEEAIVEVIESVFNVPSDKIVVLPRK